METHQNLTLFFAEKLENLRCDDDTRAYITSIFGKYKNSHFDYSKESLTLIYADATYKQDFFTFQNIGDWLFMINSMFPEHLTGAASNEYYCSIGRSSYYHCYKLLHRRWRLYEHLADRFPELSLEVRSLIREF
jgi:hypothetical protein